MYLKLCFQLFYKPQQVTHKFLNFKPSLKITLALLLSTFLIWKSIDFLLFTIDPNWNNPGVFLGNQVIIFRPWWRELIGILADSVFNFTLATFFLGVLWYLLKFLKAKNLNFSHIILWGAMGALFYLTLDVYNFCLLYFREFIPFVKPYTVYAYYAGAICAFYLQITTLAAVTNWGRFKSFVAFFIFGVVIMLFHTAFLLTLQFSPL